MNRRDALAATATLLGVTLTGAHTFLSGCSPAEKKASSVKDLDEALLDDIGEAILPETASSPGAKVARVGEFMKIIVADCYSDAEQTIFLKGIKKLNDLSVEKYASNFRELDNSEKLELLHELDKEARAFSVYKKEEDPDHYFSMIKQLAVWGYFTSEPGATKALRYVPIPGKYDGCIAYTGERAWLY